MNTCLTLTLSSSTLRCVNLQLFEDFFAIFLFFRRYFCIICIQIIFRKFFSPLFRFFFIFRKFSFDSLLFCILSKFLTIFFIFCKKFSDFCKCSDFQQMFFRKVQLSFFSTFCKKIHKLQEQRQKCKNVQKIAVKAKKI